MSKRRIAALALGAILSCTPLAPAAAADPPYEINAILSLTGQGAFNGRTTRDSFMALENAIDKQGGVRGRPIHFVIYDDQSSPQVALQIESEILKKNVPFVLGPMFSATCSAIEPMIGASGPVQYCLSSGIVPKKGSFMLAVGVKTADLMDATFRYLHDRGLTRIAYLVTTDASGQEGEKILAPAAAARGLTILVGEHFAPTDVSVSAQMVHILSMQPQAIVVWATGTPLGTVLRAYRDAGADVPLVVTDSNMNAAELKQFSSLLPKQLYSMSMPYVANIAKTRASRRPLQFYIDSLKAAALPNDHTSGDCWDAMVMYLDILRKYGFAVTAAQVHNDIETRAHYAGISGTYNFTDGSQRGLGVRDVMVMRYDAAKGWIPVSKFGGEAR